MVAQSLTTLEQVRRAGVEAWKPRARPVRSKWCEENVRLPREYSAQPGRFDIDAAHAYVREILDTVDDPAYREIVFVAVPQVGKTELVRAIICSQGEVDAAPMMLAGPDQIYAREQRDICYSIAEASPALRDRVPPVQLRNDRFIDLELSRIWLAWSGSTQRLSGRSCKIVCCSEADRWQSPLHLATQRTTAFARSMVIYEGSLVGVSARLWPLYKDSDRRHFHVPCPHCGAYQELRFFTHKGGPHAGHGGVGGLKDAKGNWRTPTEARRSAYYVCEKGCRIENRSKPKMIRRGVWCPDGCRVTEAGKLTGTPANSCRRAGFHLNKLYASTVSFGDAAEKYLTVRDSTEGMESFFNDWLGLPYEARGSTPRWKDLGIRLAGTYPRGAIPSAAYFLTAGVDVQLRGVYWIVRAWGDRKTSWLVDFGYLPKDLVGGRVISQEMDPDEAQPDEVLASDMAKLDRAVVNRRWPVLGENPLGYSDLAARRLAIDRGGRPKDTDRFLREHPGDRVIAVFGSPRIVPGTLYRPMKIERDTESGKVADEDPRCWGIEVNPYKSEIADRWMADRRQPGAWWLPSDILETAGGEDYLRQLVAEKRTFKPGRKQGIWELISNSLPNHYWDCEVYASCAADMIVGCQWEAAQWPWARAGRPRPTAPVEQLSGRGEYPEDFSAR